MLNSVPRASVLPVFHAASSDTHTGVLFAWLSLVVAQACKRSKTSRNREIRRDGQVRIHYFLYFSSFFSVFRLMFNGKTRFVDSMRA